MTKREFLKAELLKILESELKVHDFKLNKALAEFTRKVKDGWFKYQIVFLKIDEGWELNPCLLLRFNCIEDIFHKISGFEQKYQKGTPTIGTSLENYMKDGSGYRYTLTEEDQIDEIGKELQMLFCNVALPFFEKYNSLVVLDEALNTDTKDTSLTGDIFKGLKALISAKLSGRLNYYELEKFYLNYYKEFSDGFYLPEFDKLREELKNLELIH
jgi:hypothetical protein